MRLRSMMGLNFIVSISYQGVMYEGIVMDSLVLKRQIRDEIR